MANAAMLELIEITAQRISMMDRAELAMAGKHEYDEEAIEPAFNSAGHVFLQECGRSFIRWLRQEARFPRQGEVDSVATSWHRDEATPGMIAQAFVDLGLYFSHHADVAGGATVDDFRLALDQVAAQLVFTLTSEYQPLS